MLSVLLHHLHLPLPSLQNLHVDIVEDSEICALTAFLPQCTNLRTLHCEYWCKLSDCAEEEMWEAAVRRCKNLEVVRLQGWKSNLSRDRLSTVLIKLFEREGIQALKLRKIVKLNSETEQVEEDYTKQFKHLLPALQKQLQQYSQQQAQQYSQQYSQQQSQQQPQQQPQQQSPQYSQQQSQQQSQQYSQQQLQKQSQQQLQQHNCCCLL